VDEVAGVPVTKLIAERKPYYPASNEPTRLRDIYKYLLRGECGDVQLKIDREGKPLTITAKRVSSKDIAFVPAGHDRPGPEFQKIDGDIAYLKLGSVKAGQAASYVKSAEGTRGLIIDIRNYPSAFMVFELGSLLIDKPSDFVTFTFPDVVNPGATNWKAQPLAITPKAPRYRGKVVILIDERSQSQAEYTAMALRKSPGAVVIGSTTAGADGNVSMIPLPGNFRTMISGIGIFYPDRKPTQRIGIIPDIELKPTLAGMRAGRDELIEEAIRQIRKP
jgi:C-terminal processing protease CtpA/Prc